MPIMQDNLYLSVAQVAERLGVSTDSIWRWKREGKFPKAIKLGGRTTRWKLTDIEQWEAHCTMGFATHFEGWELAP